MRHFFNSKIWQRNRLLHFSILLLALLFIAALSSCSDGNKPDDKSNQVERAVLVYIVSDNTLSGYDADDIHEMLRAAQAGDLGENRLIIYHAGRTDVPRLGEITSQGLVSLVEYDRTVNSVTAERMNKVINDFKSLVPARNYGLVLWSHASAWASNEPPTGPDSAVSPQSYGDDRGAHMDIDVLADVLADKGFEFIYFDCCHMASVEVAYELRHATPYIIGSATEIPSPGMPYDLTMPLLLKGDLIGAARTTFDWYDALSGSSRTCTMSVIRTSELDNLAAATRRIFEKHPVLPDDYKPLNYRTAKPFYCYDLAHYIRALSTDEDFADWQQALDKCVIFKANTPKLWNSVSLEGHCGLSCMIVDYMSQLGNNLSWQYYYTTRWWNDVVSASIR